MALEIERKFLLKTLPDVSFDDLLFIKQIYIDNVRYRKSYSVINKKSTCFKTIKTEVSPGINEEIEEIISESLFSQIEDEGGYTEVFKKRYIWENKRIKWEIDVFLTHDGLVIGECELNTPEELTTVEIPQEIRKVLHKEVTGNKSFSNYNLAK